MLSCRTCALAACANFSRAQPGARGADANTRRKTRARHARGCGEKTRTGCYTRDSRSLPDTVQRAAAELHGRSLCACLVAGCASRAVRRHAAGAAGRGCRRESTGYPLGRPRAAAAAKHRVVWRRPLHPSRARAGRRRRGELRAGGAAIARHMGCGADAATTARRLRRLARPAAPPARLQMQRPSTHSAAVRLPPRKHRAGLAAAREAFGDWGGAAPPRPPWTPPACAFGAPRCARVA